MNFKKEKCAICGGKPEMHSSGMEGFSFESPFYVVCKECGAEGVLWHSQLKAWWAWNEKQRQIKSKQL